MSDSRTKRERFLPYAYDRHGLRCELRRVEVDGQGIEDDLDRDGYLVDLRGAWSNARLVFGFPADADLLSRVVPESERAAPPVAALLVLRCGPTLVRRGVVTPLGAGDAVVSVDLRRDELAGHAEISPFLIRTDHGAVNNAGYAAARGSRLAGARSWTVRVDLERPPTGRYLEIEYRHFSEEPSIPHAERKAMWRLEPGESPSLWLNRDHHEIAELMQHGGTRGRTAYLREVVYDRIAAAVWPRLFLIAATSVLTTGDETYGWERSVLDHLLPDLYPTATTTSARLERLRQEFDDIAQLLGRLDAVLQTRDDGVIHLQRLVGSL
jgi:hypothetical protein